MRTSLLSTLISTFWLGGQTDGTAPSRARTGRPRDVKVRVDGVGAPVGDLVGDAIPENQGVTLLVLEDHQGLLVGVAVDAHAGHFKAPLGRGGAHMGKVVEIGALVRNAPWRRALCVRPWVCTVDVPCPGRIGNEAPVLGRIPGSPR